MDNLSAEGKTLLQPYEKKVSLLLLLVSILTVLDAVASWFSIEVMGIAKEANDGLNAISALVGFEGAMVVRVIWGISLSAILAILAIRFKKESRRKLAYRGLWLIAIVLLLLFAYHVVVMSVGFLSVLDAV
jgi:hypothetical protein